MDIVEYHKNMLRDRGETIYIRIFLVDGTEIDGHGCATEYDAKRYCNIVSDYGKLMSDERFIEPYYTVEEL